MSPMSYLNNFRIQKAAEMLQQTEHSILFISTTCGFSTSSYFCKVFSAAMHCSPSEYRKRTGEYSASYAAARPL